MRFTFNNIIINSCVSFVVIASIVFWVTFLIPLQVSAVIGKPYKATVSRVVNGDTLRIYYQKNEIKVYLYGIDSPGEKQPYGREVKKYLQDKVEGKTINVVSVVGSSYGKTYVVISVNGFNINESLIRRGYAKIKNKRCRIKYCRAWKKIEKTARARKLGIWN